MILGICVHCGRPIDLNEPSGEWFHTATGDKECTDYVGSKIARPRIEVIQ